MSTESHTDRNGVTWSTYKEESLFSDYWTTRIPAVYRDPAPGFTKAATRAGLIDDIEAYAATHTVPAGDPTPSSPPPPPAMETPPAVPTSPTSPGGSPPAPRVAVSSSLLRALERLSAPTPPPASTMNTPGTSQTSQPSQPVAPGITTQPNVPGLPLATSAQSSSTKRWWVLGGVAAVLVGLGAAWGHHRNKKRQAPASPNALR